MSGCAHSAVPVPLSRNWQVAFLPGALGGLLLVSLTHKFFQFRLNRSGQLPQSLQGSFRKLGVKPCIQHGLRGQSGQQEQLWWVAGADTARLRGLCSELGRRGHRALGRLSSQTLHEGLSPKKEFQNMQKDSKVHSEVVLFSEKKFQIPK